MLKKRHALPLLTLLLCVVFAALLPIVALAKAVTDFSSFTYASYFSADYTVASTTGNASASGATISLDATGVDGTTGCNSTPAVPSTTTVALTANQTVSVTCKLGSNTTVAAPSEVTNNSDGSITFIVPATQSVKFSVTATSGTKVSGSVTFISVETATTNVPEDCAAYTYNNKVYNYLDEVITDATANGSGTIVVTASGKVYHSSVESDEDYANKTFTFTIPSGVTLLVPFDGANTFYTNGDGYAGETMVTPTAFCTLTMPKGTNIVVNGAMNVAGKFAFTNSGGQSGSPSGPLGFVNMESGSNITVNGNLYAFGYIIGSGTVTAESGSTVHEVIQMPEFRGGSQSTGMDNKVFPLSQFYVQNIEVPLTLKAGATEKTYGKVYASRQYVDTGLTLFGSGGMFELTSGSVTKWYDGSTDRLHIQINGAAKMNSVSLTLDAGLFGSTSISSKDYVLPINGAFTIRLKSGSSLSIPSTQDVLLQPNAQIIIEQNASCTVSSKLYIYDAAQWGAYCNWGHAGAGDTNCWDTPSIPVAYSPTRTKVRLHVFPRGLFTDSSGNPLYITEDDTIYEGIFGKNAGDLIAEADLAEYLTLLPDASILVDGTLTGSVYTTAGGANIYSTGTGTFTQTATDNSSVYQLMMGADYSFNSGNSEYYVEAASTPAQLKNSDGTYLATAAKANTYVYTDGKWICDTSEGKTHTGVETDHTCDVCGFETECVDTDDHNCDVCGMEGISECVDEDGNAVCDICQKVLCEHETVTPTEAVDATCETDGTKAYWTCSDCNNSYADESCTVLISDLDAWKADTTENGGCVPAIGHAYAVIENGYSWAEDYSKVTASGVCANDETHTATVESEKVESVTTDATCMATGKTVYTATFAEDPAWTNLETQTATVELEIDENAHDWADATCTEPKTCSVCGATEDEALGHSYGEPVWSWTGNDTDGYTVASAAFTCSVCQKDTQTIPDNVIDVVTTEPTTEAEGSTIYTATVTFNGQTYSDTKTVVIPKVEVTGFTVTLDDRKVISEETGKTTLDVTKKYKAGDTFTVTCAQACVVAISTDNGGTYTELTCTAVESVENTYQFTIPEDIISDFQIGIVLRGDARGDGDIRANDALRIQRYVAKMSSNSELDALTALAADARGDGGVRANDALRVQRYVAKMTTNNELEWNVAE